MDNLISFINSWAQGIIFAVIIATLIEIILPEGNNKKYVKTIIGIYILFIMIYPLISKLYKKKINIQSIIDNTTSQINKYEMSNEIAIETSAYIEDTYKKKIEEDLNTKLNEKGYEMNSVNIYINTENEETYGQINRLDIQISKSEILKEDNENNINTVNKIENVNIKISNDIKENKVQEENISQEEIDSLKDYVCTTYGVEKDKIFINETKDLDIIINFNKTPKQYILGSGTVTINPNSEDCYIIILVLTSKISVCFSKQGSIKKHLKLRSKLKK